MPDCIHCGKWTVFRGAGGQPTCMDCPRVARVRTDPAIPASKLREVVADLEERKEDRIRMCDYSAHSAYEYAIDLIESLLPESE